MSPVEWLLAGAGATLLAYAMSIAALLVAGRRMEARALGGFVPDCLVLLRRLIGDDRVPRRRKLTLLALAAYLLLPIDLVPDFIPVVGQVDDVIIAALALRYALRSHEPSLLTQHWPGPDQSLQAVMRLAYGGRSHGG